MEVTTTAVSLTAPQAGPGARTLSRIALQYFAEPLAEGTLAVLWRSGSMRPDARLRRDVTKSTLTVLSRSGSIEAHSPVTGQIGARKNDARRRWYWIRDGYVGEIGHDDVQER